jgi:hypothetical protein
MTSHPISRLRSGIALVGLGLLLAACSAGSLVTPSAPIAASVGATPAATPFDRQVGEADNGGTVSVAVGSKVTLLLRNTYWQVQGSSDPAVLALVSGPTASAAGPLVCVPGAGCGTVTAVFVALAPGRATITASRTTCGEALMCTGTAGAYEVSVVIGG